MTVPEPITESIDVGEFAAGAITANRISASTITWTTWNATTTFAASSTTATWVNWTTSTGNSTLVIDPATNRPSEFLLNYEQRVPTAEEREEAERRAAEQQQRAIERQAEAERVRERAEETLALLLTAEQLEDWQRTSSFELITQAGRRYRIRRGVAGNVKLIEQGEEVESLCAHPNGVPREDVVIAQVLALRTDEEGFRRTANISSYRRRAS